MSNYLDSGAVLPFGLLGEDVHAMMGGFNKTYNNSFLRIGVVVKSYDITDDNNRSKLTTEYDVSIIEQNKDIGVTTIIYKNCMSLQGFGSIPDFLEYSLRTMEKKTTKGSGINLSGQNGAIVLMLCLDGVSDKGIIIGGFPHPDRATNLTADTPMLVGEFNGVNVTIGPDGSLGLTQKSPTDNDGNIIDSSFVPTTAQIEADGSVQIVNSAVTLRLDKTGDVTLTAKGAVNVNCATATVTASDTATVTATNKAVVEAKEVDLGKNASESAVLGDTFKKMFDSHIHPTPVGPTDKPVMPMPASNLSKKVKVE